MRHISISELAAKIGESEDRLISVAEKTVFRRMERVQASDMLVAAQAEQLAREVGKSFSMSGGESRTMNYPDHTSAAVPVGRKQSAPFITIDAETTKEWSSSPSLQRKFHSVEYYANYKAALARKNARKNHQTNPVC